MVKVEAADQNRSIVSALNKRTLEGESPCKDSKEAKGVDGREEDLSCELDSVG